MKDKKLLFDRKCHVLYSRPCKKEIRAKIALHYPEAERETVWEQVQRQYADFLSDWRTDLGGKKNFHNGVGGTYDCIAIMSSYAVCKAVYIKQFPVFGNGISRAKEEISTYCSFKTFLLFFRGNTRATAVHKVVIAAFKQLPYAAIDKRH